jgi:hypothetical protein
MKVILVGTHNKPDTNPLCEFTRTGKLLQRVIDTLPDVEFEKTNLYDVDYYPSGQTEKTDLAIDWHWRIRPNDVDDLIILLGAEVCRQFFNKHKYRTLGFTHPSSVRSHDNKDKYVAKMIRSIKNEIHDET